MIDLLLFACSSRCLAKLASSSTDLPRYLSFPSHVRRFADTCAELRGKEAFSWEETLLEGESLRERLVLLVVEVMMWWRCQSFCDVLKGQQDGIGW